MRKTTASLIALALACTAAWADEPLPTAPVAASVTDDGQLDIPGFWMPYSEYASPEARKTFVKILRPEPKPPATSLEMQRAQADEGNRKWLAAALARYPAKIAHQTMGGVPVDVVTPASGVKAANAKRVLINMHGGAFMWGAGAGGQLEAVPVAVQMGVKVVTVDYRMGPEHRFPAASEDVAAVYKELLKTYPARNIGIYGCSAGGILTAQSLAWFQTHKLPRPGAAGVFCAGGGDLGGDTAYTGNPVTGQPGVPKGQTGLRADKLPYFAGADINDPLLSPVKYPDVLAKFPPTLVITGTRDFLMSSAANQHRMLVNAGVEADLHVWDGMWHAFFMDADLPESREAYAVMAKFFDRHLGKK